jgi:tRNA(Ile)-lysidine synthase
MRSLAPFPDPDFAEVAVVRPLLDVQRRTLRDLLLAHRQPWIEDPMNADARFARVRVRLAWPQLAPLGLSPERLAETAIHLARASEALEVVSQAVLARACRPCRGGFAIDPAALAGAPPELGLRALAKLLMATGRNPYRPRFDRLSALLTAITQNSLGGGRTLHGCRIGPAPKSASLFGPGTLLIEVEKGRSGLGKPRPKTK